MGSLPMPPMPPNYTAPSGPAPLQGYNSPPTQLQSAPPSEGANLIQGINAFLEQYRKSKETDRQEAMGHANQHIQNLLLGLPVDLKKTASYMKRAGMDLDFEGAPTPQPERSPSTHTSDFPQVNTPAPRANPGGGFWDRVKEGYLGQGGQINTASPGMDALRQLQSRGQQNMQIDQSKANVEQKSLGVQSTALDAETQKQAIFMAAMKGNPQAIEMAQRMGWKDLPADEDLRIGRLAGMDDQAIGKAVMLKKFGNTKLLEIQIDLANGMKKYFGNDLAKAMKYSSDVLTQGGSALQPDVMSVDDRLKVLDATTVIQKEHPTLPINIANAYALAEASGNTSGAQKLKDFISSNYPTAGNVDWTKWKGGMEQQEKQFTQMVTNQNRDYNLNIIKTARDQMGDEWRRGFDLVNSKGSTAEEKAQGKRMMEAANTQGRVVTVTLPDGQKFPMAASDVVTRAQSTIFPWSTPDLELTNPAGKQASMKPGWGSQALSALISGGQAAQKAFDPNNLVQLMTPPPDMKPEEAKVWQKYTRDLIIGTLMGGEGDITAGK